MGGSEAVGVPEAETVQGGDAQGLGVGGLSEERELQSWQL